MKDWWLAGAWCRKRVRGWNLRTLVCERCVGKGWVLSGPARDPVAIVCPFCGGAVRLSLEMFAERIGLPRPLWYELRALHRFRDGRSRKREVSLAILNAIVKAGAFPAKETR